MTGAPIINPITGLPYATRQAPAEPETNLALNFSEDLGPLAYLPTFSFRNGELSDARSLLVKPAIPAIWHWRPINGLPPTHAIRNVGLYIRTYLAVIMNAKPAEWSDVQAKKVAIVLGVARAVSTELYRLNPDDFTPVETAPHLLTATQNTPPYGPFKITAVTGLSEAARTRLTTPLELSDTEKAAISSIHMCAIGLIPLQGYSLLMTNHHYLSDPKGQSRKAFNVVERQNWQSTAVASWWQDDVEILRDALWHKACHPVNITILTTMASDLRIRKMLIEAGAGPAASRLPALETEMRAANSYRTLFQTVRPLFEICGASLDYSMLEDAINAVSLFPQAQTAPAMRPPLSPNVPAFVVDRRTALDHLANVLSSNMDRVAYCYGLYDSLSNQNQTLGGTTTTDTLKTSYSLSKLKNQRYASFVAGQQAFGDFTSASNRARVAGEYRPPPT